MGRRLLHGRPHGKEAQPKARSAAAVPQRQRRRGPCEGEPDGALNLQTRPLLPNDHRRTEPLNEANEPPAAGDIILSLCLGRPRESGERQLDGPVAISADIATARTTDRRGGRGRMMAKSNGGTSLGSQHCRRLRPPLALSPQNC